MEIRKKEGSFGMWGLSGWVGKSDLNTMYEIFTGIFRIRNLGGEKYCSCVPSIITVVNESLRHSVTGPPLLSAGDSRVSRTRPGREGEGCRLRER